MTRAEVLESLAPYPDNILRVGHDGVVRLSRFIEWLEAFQPIGSSEKLAVCDGASFAAVCHAAISRKANMFMHSDGPEVKPYEMCIRDSSDDAP